MIRLSTSRPKRSVPSGWSQSPPSVHTGGISLREMSPSVGLCGDRYGARIAVTTSAARITTGNQGSWRLPARMADLRMSGAVEEVHAQVASQVEGAQHQDAGLHDRIVAGGDRLEDQSPQPRPGEHGLSDDGSGQGLHTEQDGEGEGTRHRRAE